MKVLIVDDDERKAKRVSDIVAFAAGDNDCEIAVACCVQEAVAYMSVAYDLLILDANLPMRKGEPPARSGGRRVLDAIVRRSPGLNPPKHIVGLTAFQDVAAEFRDAFESEGWHLLEYSIEETGWEEVLRNRIYHIRPRSNAGGVYDYDVAIITALVDRELEAVLKCGIDFRSDASNDDCTIYYSGEVDISGRRVRVVSASACEMGMSAAAALATKIAMRFKPRYIIMCGIAAGIDMNYGDIMIADELWDYGAGKIVQTDDNRSAFKPSAPHQKMGRLLRERVVRFVGESAATLGGIRGGWQGNVPATPLNVRVGPFVSGAAVVEDLSVISKIVEQNRKVLGLDMEAYGVAVACDFVPDPRPECLVIKSVSDNGVRPKTDDYQKYAAYTSAMFAKEIICNVLFQR